MTELTEARKKELACGLAYDLDRFIERKGIIQEYIDCTCRTEEEMLFMREVSWWVAVQDEEGEMYA